MDISLVTADWRSVQTPLLALPLWEGRPLPAPLDELVESEDWSGKPKQTIVLYPRGAVAARRVLLVGLGKPGDVSAEPLREAAAVAVQRARELRADRLSLVLPAGDELSSELAAQAAAEGGALGAYRFTRKSEPEEPAVDVGELSLVVEGDRPEAARGAARGAAIARGVALARDLANRPGNDLTPARLAEAAEQVARRFGMTSLVLGLDELKLQGFGGILAVGQGSANEPRFVVMEHGARRPGVPTICLVGKGITFDSGGISIKPAENMDQMKMDMGGAAAVVGAMHVVGELRMPLHVVGLIASAENMPSATSYRPGDIVTTLSGKTIEVLNTDAEGRIVLADALFYAQRYQPDAIVDLATLTGAIMVALGPHATGMMSNHDDLSARLALAGERTGERVWRLPLLPGYGEAIRSEIADVKNTGGRYGGAINAAAFLQHFVGDYPWAHLDIAGTAWVDKQSRPYVQKGATGVGVRLLSEALRAWSPEQ